MSEPGTEAAATCTINGWTITVRRRGQYLIIDDPHGTLITLAHERAAPLFGALCQLMMPDQAGLWERLRATEAQAALLRDALADIESWCQSLIDKTDIIDPAWVVQRAAIVRDLDAGAALLVELEAARAVIGTLKEVFAGDVSRSALTVALAKYDEAKARR